MHIKFHKSPLGLALVVSGLLMGMSQQVLALGLGTAKVLSPIGQPLLAEIDINDITPEEASNLVVRVPGADAFKAAGVDYSRIAGDVQVTVQKRANGRSYLRLASNQTVTDPFLDIIVEASWGSGRVVRDYTLLLDPPSAANVAAQKPAVQEATPITPVARSAPAPRVSTPRAARVDSSTGEPKVATTKAARPQAPVPSPSIATSGQTYTVQGGDSLSKIANQTKPATVSLDQMLAALFQANQSSFANGNINRLQKGAVLQLPADGAAGSISAGDARRIVVAQSRDFANYRAKLAKAVSDKPAAVADGSQQAGAGKLDTKVQDSKTAAAQPDKLTLSKGAVAGKPDAQVAQADQVAKTREAKASQERMAELNRNVSELSKIAGGGAAAAAATASKPAAPGLNVPVKPPVATTAPVASAPAVVVPPVAAVKPPEAAKPVVVASAPVIAPPAPVAAASAAVVAPAPAASVAVAPEVAPAVVASAPTVPAPVKKVAVAPVPAPPEPSFIESITGHDLFIPGLGLLAVGLGGLGAWRLLKRKNSSDSSSFDSQSQGTDSFFGGTGGARVDTRDSVLASSMYSSSQLNANEVDPVAEADVYLAYGRDLQAEEILKEALRSQPDRHSIRVKLLEIYAKRRDARSFEVVATELFSMTQGQGEDWERAVELGRELEPANALYNTQVGSSQLLNTGMSSDFSPSASPFDSPTTMPASRSMASGFAATDLTAARTTLAPSLDAETDLDLDLDFGLDDEAPAPAKPVASFSSPSIGNVVGNVASGVESMSFDSPNSLLSPRTTPTPAPANSGMEFDLSGINLDVASAHSTDPMDDPYETKFALAEECQRLGDKDSARSILKEIVGMATGAIRSKAEKMLGDIR
jgi:pilus assembly protein FimV